MSATGTGISNAISGAGVAIGLIGAFSGPTPTQGRFALHKVYYFSPSGELLAQKLYSKNKIFGERDIWTSYTYKHANIVNTEIINEQIIIDIESKKLEKK